METNDSPIANIKNNLRKYEGDERAWYFVAAYDLADNLIMEESGYLQADERNLRIPNGKTANLEDWFSLGKGDNYSQKQYPDLTIIGDYWDARNVVSEHSGRTMRFWTTSSPGDTPSFTLRKRCFLAS